MFWFWLWYDLLYKLTVKIIVVDKLLKAPLLIVSAVKVEQMILN